MKENEKALLKNRLAETAVWVEQGLADLDMFRSPSKLAGFAEYSLNAG